ncbi:MAG: hypothetical protein RLZZ28_223 [Bacteroidota bacterium]
MLQVDYLIIGQGLAGSFLSHQLIGEGCSVMVVDEEKPDTASKVASGVINPVTGRRMVRTWEIETLMPFAVKAYGQLGEELGLPLIKQCNILDFHPTPQMKLAFAERFPVEKEYLRLPENEHAWNNYFNYFFGYGEIEPCWLIDLGTMLELWRKYLAKKSALLEEKFVLENCTIRKDAIEYKNILARKILFSDGVSGFSNPYFHLLPYANNKGEALIVAIPDLPSNHIYKQGINIVPWRNNLFWVGSSYDWNYTDPHPSEAFKAKVLNQLNSWLKLPYQLIDHLASERPANMERRPFVGLHPTHPSVGILNGFGTKGCTLAPFFAKQLSRHLLYDEPIMPEADVRRFSRILSR